MTGGPSGGGSTQAPGTGSMNTPVSPANIAALTGGATGASPMAGVNAPNPSMSGIPGATGTAISGALQNPQWMQGLKLGQQLSQMGGQQQQHPMMQMAQRPQGAPQGFGGGGMPTGAVPGASGMMPQSPQMPGGLMGQQQGTSQVNPQLLQMLLRSKGMGG